MKGSHKGSLGLPLLLTVLREKEGDPQHMPDVSFSPGFACYTKRRDDEASTQEPEAGRFPSVLGQSGQCETLPSPKSKELES